MFARTAMYVGAAGLLALAASAEPVAGQGQPDAGPLGYTVYNLGTLGGSVSSGNTINNLGWAMGNANLSGDQATHATVWAYGFTFDLGTLGGPNSVIDWPVHNDRGVIAGIAETAETDPLMENWSCSDFFPTTDHHVCVGFRWADGAMVALQTLGGTNGYASGVNQQGQIVGWAETSTHDPTCNPPQVLQFEAVRYGPAGKVSELPPLHGDSDGAATAINYHGDAVGITGTCDNAVGAYTARHAVIWRNGVPTRIPTFGGKGWNTPTDINRSGQVVGFADLPGDVVNGVLTFNPVAFIWSAGTGTRKILPLPGDTNSIAWAINDQGDVVGQSFGGPEGSRAFIWRNGVSYDLNTYIPASASLYLLYAEGIDNSGQITGQACVLSGGACSTDTPAFLAVPAPFQAELKTAASAPPLAASGQLVQSALRSHGFRFRSSTE